MPQTGLFPTMQAITSAEFTAGIARINAGSTVKCQAQLQNWTGSINAKCWITRIA